MADFVKCQICSVDYDLDKHIAVILSQCGHITCRFCADNILKSGNKACPVCKKPFPSGTQATKYSIDLNIREKVEYASKFQRCSVHNGQVLDLYCRTDKRRICVECQYSKDESGHKGHIVERIQDLEPLIKSRLEAFFANEEDYGNFCEQGKKIIEKNRQEEFSDFKDLERKTKIMALESLIIAKAAIDQQEDLFDNEHGGLQIASKTLQYPFKNLKDSELSDLLELEESKDDTVSSINFEKLNNDVKEARGHVQRPQITQDNSTIIEAPNKLKSIQVSSYLNFQVRDQVLVVTASDTLNKNVMLDIEQWDKGYKGYGSKKSKIVRELSITFNKFNYNEEDNIILDYMATRLRNNSITLEYQNTISLRTPKTRLEEHLIEFPRALFSQPGSLRKVCLCFIKSIGSDRIVRLFTERVMPKIYGLTILEVICEHTDLEESTLIEFAKTISSMKILQDFKLTLKKVSLNLSALAAVQFDLPNLVHLAFSTDLAGDNSNPNAIPRLFENLMATVKEINTCTIELTNQNVPDPEAVLPIFFAKFPENSKLDLRLPALTGGKLDEYKKRARSIMKNSEKIPVLVVINSERM